MTDPGSSVINNHFLCLQGVQQEAVSMTPVTESICQIPIFTFLSILDKCHVNSTSEYFWMWQDSELYLKSAAQVNKDGAKTVPRGALVLITVSETQFSDLTNCGPSVRSPVIQETKGGVRSIPCKPVSENALEKSTSIILIQAPGSSR